MIARRLQVAGKVQGVGFRYSLQEQAERLGIRGWVRNRRDGSVEALVQGTPEAVDAITAWARQGPRGSRVTEVRSEPADEPPQEGFRITATT